MYIFRPSCVLSLLLVVSQGCQPAEQICEPGETQICICPGSRSGAQSCNEDGEGWSSCACEQPGDAAVDSDAAVDVDANANDAAVEVDAGVTPDAAIPDSAVPTDSAQATDSASGVDATVAVDAASGDAASPADSATPLDAVVAQDAEAPVDAHVEDATIEDATTEDAAQPSCSNPVVNTCGADLKCAFIVDDPSPTTVHIGCVSEGSVGLDQPCTLDSLTGYDDCLAGLFCLEGQCAEICSRSPDSCPESQLCAYQGVLGSATFGTCEPYCDVLNQDCEGGDGCYFVSNFNATQCLLPTAEDFGSDCAELTGSPGVQGDCCSYINSCAVGLGCIGRSADLSGQVCAAFCDPTDTIGSSDCTSTAGAGHYCVSLNRFYSDLNHVEDHVGLCIDEAIWGPATCFNDVQDSDEDGVNCCLSSGDCLCAYDC